MFCRILENKILYVVAVLGITLLFITAVGLNITNDKTYLRNHAFQSKINHNITSKNLIEYSPFQVEMTINITPSLNESFDILSSVKSDINLSEVDIQIYIPSGFEYLSGNTSWNGSLNKDQIKNFTVSAKIIEMGEFAVYLHVEDSQSYNLENWSGLYFYVNESNISVYESPYRSNPDIPKNAVVDINEGTGTPGQGDDITISGRWQVLHYFQQEWINIPYAKVELWRKTPNDSYCEQTSYTDENGEFIFNPCSPGELSVNISSTGNLLNVLNITDIDGNFYNWTSNWINLSEDKYLWCNLTLIDNDRGIWCIYNATIHEYLWFKNITGGWCIPYAVNVVWPYDGSCFWGQGPNLHIGIVWEWSKYAAYHEYAHAIMYYAYGYDLPYGWGPSPHSQWNESSPGFALKEGWAEFIGRLLNNELYDRNWTWADKLDCGWDGDIVEGAIQDLFYDIYDGIDSSDYSNFSFSGCGDNISDFNKLWIILKDGNHPQSIHGIWNEWTPWDENIWAIFYNQRINKDLIPPTLPNSNLSNINISTPTPVDNVDVTVNWSGQEDDLSGIYGYAISWTENESATPDNSTVDVFTNETTETLSNGTWYLNIRPVDKAENWNNGAYSVGPFIIGLSNPILTPPEGGDDKCVQPENGTEDTNFLFKVHYFDYDSHEPKAQYKQLIIDNDEENYEIMNGNGSNSDYTASLYGYDEKIGRLGVHHYHFYFEDEGDGTARLPKEEEGYFNFIVKPKKPIINGPEKVRPLLPKLNYKNYYKYILNLSNFDNLQNFSVKIDMENEFSRIERIEIPNGNPLSPNNNTSGWFNCTSGTIVMYCRWPMIPFFFNPGNYNISVITKYKGDNMTLFSEIGKKEVNVNIFNFGYIPSGIFWNISTNGPYNAQVEEEINLNCSIIDGPSSYTVIWDFGDGGDIVIGPDAIHTYDEPGYYPIICTVEDNSTGTRWETFTYANISGVKLTTNSYVVLKDQPVNFTATLYGMEPSSNHWYVFSTGHQVQDSDADGIASITTSFSSCGIHTVNVTLHNGSVNGSIIDSDSVTIKVVPFKVDAGGPYAAMSGEEISFEGVVYYDYSWISAVWDFGDGNYGTGLSTTHTYDAEVNTTYNVTLTVSIWGVGNSTNSTTATIWNITGYNYPVAVLDGPYCGNKNQSIRMDGSDSTGYNLRYFWKIGKGLWEEDDPVIYKTFSDVGDNYPESVKVELKVVDQLNFSDTTSTHAIISELTADFHWSPPIPTDMDTVYFYDDSAPDGCNYPYYWHWNFGDNSTSTEENPQHQYGDDGYYYVRLTVMAGSKQSTVTKRIYIDNVAPEAGFNTSTLVVPVYENVTFNCTSTDPDGEVVLWERILGDGDYSYSKNTSHNYSNSGFYSVTTYIMDDDFDQDYITKDNQLLIADAIVSKDFNESSSGWNVTRFSSLQSGIDAIPEGGILVVLNDTYSAADLKVNKSMDIYAIQQGYSEGDSKILYGDVEIQGDGKSPIFNISASNVKIKGFTLTHGGMQIEGDYVTVQDCTFIEKPYGVTCENSSHITIFNTTMSGNEAYSIKLTNSDNVTIQETEISYTYLGIYIDNSVDNSIIDCNISETSQGIQLVKDSDDNTIQRCGIYHIEDTAILIDDSNGNTISDCKIVDGYKGVEVANVDPDKPGGISPSDMLNIIQDTNFTNCDYGVYLYNSSHTRIGKKFWSFGGMEGLSPIYYHAETPVSPMLPFPSTLDNATSLFAHNDYSIYIDHSNYNVVDGVAIAPVFSSQNNSPSSCQNGISIINSDNNMVASCLIQNANFSAINITESSENTICLCMLKENQHGVTVNNGVSNMFIACSFFNNTYYGIELKEEAVENFVMYNDFVFNSQSGYQAYDAGEGNLWDDDGWSLWRELVCGEITDGKTIGNFWSDYDDASFSEDGTGPIPLDPGSTSWLPTGETPYDIYGPSKSQDHGPLLLSIWPENWYIGDYPWLDPEEPYLLPPIPYP